MKYVTLRCSLLLALALPLAGAGCDQGDDPGADPSLSVPADQPAPAPAANQPAAVQTVVESTQQSAATICSDVATLLIPAGPGHPFNLCRWDHVCYTFDPVTFQFTKTITGWHLGSCPPNI